MFKYICVYVYIKANLIIVADLITKATKLRKYKVTSSATQEKLLLPRLLHDNVT